MPVIEKYGLGVLLVLCGIIVLVGLFAENPTVKAAEKIVLKQQSRANVESAEPKQDEQEFPGFSDPQPPKRGGSNGATRASAAAADRLCALRARARCAVGAPAPPGLAALRCDTLTLPLSGFVRQGRARCTSLDPTRRLVLPTGRVAETYAGFCDRRSLAAQP